MMRKVFVSVLATVATLVVVPSVLAALSSPSAFGASFKHGNVVTRGWASPQAIDAKRLRIGAPVTQSITIANDGSLPATYRLKARIAVTSVSQANSPSWQRAARTEQRSSAAPSRASGDSIWVGSEPDSRKRFDSA